MRDKRARRILYELHAWSGVAIGLVVHAMFFFGAIALFYEDLACWEDRSQHTFGERGTFEEAFTVGARALPADTRTVALYEPEGSSSAYALWYLDPASDAWTGLSVDVARGVARARDVHATRFLFSLHYLWHEAFPIGRTVAGVAAAMLVLALVTGVVVHLPQLAPQFGRFRPEAKPRVATTDVHKLLGVLGLPFQLVFALTGAVLILGPVFASAYAGPVFGGRDAPIRAARRSRPTLVDEPSPVAGGLDAQLAVARRAMRGFEPRSIRFEDYGTDDATIEVAGPVPGAFSGEGTITFRASDGAMVATDGPRVETAIYGVRRVVTGLHYAKYGGASLRVLYALLALGTSATALTGMFLWLMRRAPIGGRVLRAVTEATATGSMIATSAMLLAVRLVPIDAPARGRIEELVFAASWGLVYLDSVLASDLRRAFLRHLAIAGSAFVAIPFATSLGSDRGLLGALIGAVRPDTSVARVEASAVVLGGVALIVALGLSRVAAPAAARTRIATVDREAPCG